MQQAMHDAAACCARGSLWLSKSSFLGGGSPCHNRRALCHVAGLLHPASAVCVLEMTGLRNIALESLCVCKCLLICICICSRHLNKLQCKCNRKSYMHSTVKTFRNIVNAFCNYGMLNAGTGPVLVHMLGLARKNSNMPCFCLLSLHINCSLLPLSAASAVRNYAERCSSSDMRLAAGLLYLRASHARSTALGACSASGAHSPAAPPVGTSTALSSRASSVGSVARCRSGFRLVGA